MAILHLVRCDACDKDTPMTVSLSARTLSMSSAGMPTLQASDYVVPPSIKQVDGRHFCSWPCVSKFAGAQVVQP